MKIHHISEFEEVTINSQAEIKPTRLAELLLVGMQRPEGYEDKALEDTVGVMSFPEPTTLYCRAKTGKVIHMEDTIQTENGSLFCIHRMQDGTIEAVEITRVTDRAEPRRELE